MMALRSQAATRGVSLIEVLCAIAIIAILAGLLLGPVARALQRARAMQWAQDAEIHLEATVQQLGTHFQGKLDFPLVTLSQIEAQMLVSPSELRFLKDRRVTFHPFAGTDPDDQVVVQVRIEAGFLTEAGRLVAIKERITKPPG
jgi:prepilin-type N-terminal cleavage/methylation domain-containing protein